VLPIFGGDTPRGIGIALQCEQPLVLRRLRELQPDFDDEGAAVGQQAFEMGKEAESLGEMIEFARGVGIGAQCVGVPATCVDRHAAARRETAPVTPHGRALALLVGGLVKSKGLDAARVEPSVEEIDDVALARGFVAGDYEQNGKRGVLELDLHLDERAAQGGHAGLVIFFWEARRAVCLRHEGEKWRGGAELSRLGSYFGAGRRIVTERVETALVGVKVNGVLRSRETSQSLPLAVR